MFPRAAKSAMQLLNQRNYHVTKTNLKDILRPAEKVTNSVPLLQQSSKTGFTSTQNIIPLNSLKLDNLKAPSQEGQALKSRISTGAHKDFVAGRKVNIDLAQAADHRLQGNLWKMFVNIVLTESPEKKAVLAFLRNSTRTGIILGGIAATMILRLLVEFHEKALLVIYAHVKNYNYAELLRNLERNDSIRKLMYQEHVRKIINEQKLKELKEMLKGLLEKINKKLAELKIKEKLIAAESKLKEKLKESKLASQVEGQKKEIKKNNVEEAKKEGKEDTVKEKKENEIKNSASSKDKKSQKEESSKLNEAEKKQFSSIQDSACNNVLTSECLPKSLENK